MLLVPLREFSYEMLLCDSHALQESSIKYAIGTLDEAKDFATAVSPVCGKIQGLFKVMLRRLFMLNHAPLSV